MSSSPKALIVCFLLTLAACGSAGKDEAVSAIPFTKGFVDPTSEWSLQAVGSTRFNPLTGSILDGGFSSSAFWYEFKAPHFGKETKWFLVFESLTLDHLEIYASGNLQTPVAKLGDHFPRSTWPVEWSDFPTLSIESDQVYYIRLKSTSLIKMPLTIRTEANLRAFTERRVFITAMYAGFILMLAFAAVLLFIALRDFVYLLYAAYITLQTIAFAALFSSFYRLLWPEAPYIQNHLYFFAQAMSLATGTAFFRVFMDLPTRKPAVSNLVLGVSIVSLLIAFGTLLSSQNVIFSRSLTAIYFLWIPVFLVLTMGEITRGRVDMWMFMLVWGAVYLAGILYMLSSAGIIPYHNLLFYGPTILFPFDAIFFLVTLYQRYRNIELARSQLEREMKSTLARLAGESRIKANNKEKGKYPRSKLAGMDIGEKLAKLDQILRVEKAFKKEDLTLPELAERIGVTPHQLSEMCNSQLNTSFPRLLAYHRVREATDLLLQGELNILQIAFEAGFASKSAFNIEFKRVTGLTPREYRSQSRPTIWEADELKTGA